MDNLLKSVILTPLNILYRINPKLELEILFRLKCGYKLNLAHPRTYNEKIQWIKLYDKNPLMTKCCDKFAVREYVRSKGYGDILNELIWEGFNPEEIPFDKLPKKFVIKVTHGSTFNIICKNKAALNRNEVISKCRKWLSAKFLEAYGEWFYGVERPRVIVEKFLDGDNGEALFDYKIFCFNGIPKMVYIDTWKDGNHHINAYDIDLNYIKGVELGYPNDETTLIKKPDRWNEMVEIAKKLSEDFLHVRVDFYYTHGRIYFGELTFTKGAGFGKIKPIEFDYKMGDWLALPIRGNTK